MSKRPADPNSPTCPPRWLWHYQTLQSQRDRLMGNCVSQFADVSKPTEPQAMDIVDSATDGFDHDMAFSMLSHEQNSLHEINAAIHRIFENKYGICEESGLPIPEERLQAVPWTRYTREVAESMEKQGFVNGPHLGALASVRRIRPINPDGIDEQEEKETKQIQPDEVVKFRKQSDYEPPVSETETWSPTITPTLI